MVRIRYVGEQLIARAFEHTFHRKHWDQDHGLASGQVTILTANPQFEVEGVAPLCATPRGAPSVDATE